MEKNYSKIISGILLSTGLIVIGSILIWSPVCEKMIELANGNMTHMKCYYTGQASILLSIILIVAAIESLFTHSSKSWTFIAIGVMLLLVTSSSKLGIGLCTKETMPCHSTALWIRGGGVVTIVFGIISLFRGSER